MLVDAAARMTPPANANTQADATPFVVIVVSIDPDNPADALRADGLSNDRVEPKRSELSLKFGDGRAGQAAAVMG